MIPNWIPGPNVCFEKHSLVGSESRTVFMTTRIFFNCNLLLIFDILNFKSAIYLLFFCLPDGLQPSRKLIFFCIFCLFLSQFCLLWNFWLSDQLNPDLQYCFNVHSHLTVNCIRYFCGRFSPGLTVFAPTLSCSCPTPRFICVSCSSLADTFWTARMTHRVLHLCEQQHSSGHFLNFRNDSQSAAAVWAASYHRTY